MKTWGFAISFTTFQYGNSSEYTHKMEDGVACSSPSGPRYANPAPVLRYWQLVLSTSGTNEYSSTR